MTGLFDDRFGAPGTYDIMQCPHCGLEQTWPRLTEVELKKLYERFYNWEGECDTTYTKFRELFLSSTFYRFWLKWDGDISFHLRRGTGRLLDVGCNEGRGLTFYSINGFQAEGLEINERAAAVARRRGFTVYNTPLEEFSPANHYDVVVLANVLEHAFDPPAMLTQVRRLLSPQGQVWISCPNASSYWRRLFRRHWINWHVPFHLWHFSPATLKEVLGRAHFRVVNLETFTPALWLALSFCAKFGSRAGRANRLMRSPTIVAALMLGLQSLALPFLASLNQRLEGDCLVLTAQPDA
jgi:2-polyprenyl-3-methyl-5-hydroxy-6-metoxy-1,4-benzoquinol methylase